MLLSGLRPRLLGDIVQVHGEDDPRRSDVTLLVACLLTLGIPPTEQEYFHSTRQLIRGAQVWRTIWSLREESKCRRFRTKEMIDAWTNGVWLLQNPQHPLAVMRGGLTYARAFSHTPKFTVEERLRIETPDTWIETACYNLIVLLRDMPETLTATRDLTWFAHDRAGAVPRCMPEPEKKRLLNYVESTPEKRAKLRAA